MGRFNFNGKVILASSKKEAIQKIVASKKVTASAEADAWIKKVLEDYVPKEFLDEHEKELEAIFDKHCFWNRKENTYEYTFYRDQNDEITSSWLEDIETFDAYHEKLWEAYRDSECELFRDIMDDIVELLENNDVELKQDADELRLALNESIPVYYPNFLDDTINTYIEVKNTSTVKKFLFGSDSNINIATKCVKGKFEEAISKSLVECTEEWKYGDLSEFSDKDKIQPITKFLDFQDSRKETDELLYLVDVEITIREYLSILDKNTDWKEKRSEVDVSNKSDMYLNYGWNPYYKDEIKNKSLDKLNVDDILKVSLKDIY